MDNKSQPAAPLSVEKMAEEILNKYEAAIILDWKELGYKESHVIAAMVEMYQAAKAQAPPSPVWVKASERLPQPRKWVHIKRISDGYPLVGRYYEGRDYIMDTYETRYRLDEIEWLDESALPVNSELLSFLEYHLKEVTATINLEMNDNEYIRACRKQEGIKAAIQLVGELNTDAKAAIQKAEEKL